MIRRCDGTDPNLLKPVDRTEPIVASDGEAQALTGSAGSPWPDYEPCDCGKVFDDVNHSTIYPHESW